MNFRSALAVALVALAAMALLTSQILKLNQPTSTSLQELRVGLPTSISAIDIHFAKAVADFEVLGKVYETLFKIDVDESGNVVYRPWLVERYVKLNSTTYLFMLKNGVRFHNGKTLDAWDVKASVERAMNYGPIGRMLLADSSGNPLIEEIDVINSTAFTMRLGRPFAVLPEHLAHLAVAIMPKEIAEKYSGTPINLTSDIIGTGPYKLIRYEPGSEVVLEAFEGYWGDPYNVRRVTYKILPDITARLTALFNNDVDVVTGITPDTAGDVASRGFKVLNVSGTRLVIIAVNVISIPDVRVREALNYAVDKGAIVNEVLRGYGAVAQWVVPPVFPDVVPQQPYEYNLSKAHHLISDAGFRGDRPLRLLVSTRSPKDLEVAQVIQRYLKDVGVNVDVVPMEHNAFLQKVFTEHDFDLALYGPSPSSLYYGLTYWRTGSSLNGPNYSNREFDELLDRLASEVDDSLRAKLLAKAQEILWRDCPAIWLYVENLIYAANPKVEGLRVVLAYLDLSKTYVRG